MTVTLKRNIPRASLSICACASAAGRVLQPGQDHPRLEFKIPKIVSLCARDLLLLCTRKDRNQGSPHILNTPTPGCRPRKLSACFLHVESSDSPHRVPPHPHLLLSTATTFEVQNRTPWIAFLSRPGRRRSGGAQALVKDGGVQLLHRLRLRPLGPREGRSSLDVCHSLHG